MFCGVNDRRCKLTKHIVARSLAKTGNVSRTAIELGVTRCTVQRAMRRWSIKLKPDASPVDAVCERAIATDQRDDAQIGMLSPKLPDSVPEPRKWLDMNAFRGEISYDCGRRRH